MGKENGRGKSRRRNISQARKFLNREGKKLCSAALCVSLLFGSVLNTTVAANKDTDDDGYEFELSRASLYQALQDAVLNGDTVDEDMEFRGSAAEEYSEMFAPSGSLYELKPEIEDNDGKVQLRVFAKLDQDIDLDSEYEAAGTEEIMFLLTNRSDEAQKAVIYMDDKYTEEIEVAPGKAIAVQEDETSQGPAGGGAGNGGGSSSGGSAAGGETPADTETTGPADEGGQAPDNGGAPTESQPEETTGTENEDDVTTPGGATDSTEGNETVTDGNGETGDSADDKTDDSATSDNDNSTSVEDGDNENGGNGGDAENTGDPNTDSDNAGNENQSGGQTGAGEGGSENTGNTENGGGSTENSDGGNSSTGGDSTTSDGGSGSNGGDSSSDSSDSGNSGSDSATTTAAISFHKASWVAAPVATDSDMPVATSSDLATNSDLEKLIDGELYEAVRLRENGAVAFVTTLDDLGVMDGWGPIVFGQKFEADIDGFRVRAIARKGVLRDAEEMRVVQLTEEEHPDEYAETVKALEDSETGYAGMMALDISFYDSEANEVEPEGEVQVSIEMKQGVLPQDVDPETVTVQHLKEEADGISVEDVADAADFTDGIVALADAVELDEIELTDEAEAVAVFSVDSFSTFTITWSEWYWFSRYSTYASFELMQVNDNGSRTEIPVDDFSIRCGNGQEVAIADQIQISGYTYYGTEYQYGDKTASVDKIRAIRGWRNNWTLQYHNIETNEWENVEQDAKFSVLYKKKIGSVTTVDQGGKHDKYVVDNKDGTYDLSLTISGEIGTVTEPAPLDVVYVLDRSGSMSYRMDWDISAWLTGDTRIKEAKEVIENLTTKLAAKDTLDVRFSLVTFGNQAERRDWTNAPGVISSELNEIKNLEWNVFEREGTNYQAGIQKTKEQLADGREDGKQAQRVVIFISDGNPTYYYNDSGSLSGDGSTYSAEALRRAGVEVSSLDVNYFYTIGMGPRNGYDHLNELNDYVLEGVVEEFFDAGTSTTELQKVFDKIEENITIITCSNVTIQDTLSDYAQLVDEENPLTNLSIQIKNANGEVIQDSGTSNTLTWNKHQFTATYDSTNRQIKLDLDSKSGYELEKGYTYQVTAHIKPTDKAYEDYKAGGNRYPAFGDEGTGDTSSLRPGFYSNDNDEEKTFVKYTYDGAEKTLAYPKPVIQLQQSNLTIEKKVDVSGIKTDAKKQEITKLLEDNLQFEIYDKDALDKAVDPKEVEPLKTVNYKDFVDGKLDVAMLPGTYVIKELGGALDQAEGLEDCVWVEADSQINGQEVSVLIGEDAKVTFTNTYKEGVTLTVLKEVAGLMAETQKTWEFSIEVKRGGKTIEYGEFGLKSGESYAAEMAVMADDEVTIRELTDDSEYETTIFQNNATYTPSTSSPRTYTKTLTEIDVTEDILIKFVNGKGVNIPTGVFLDKLPYLLMFTIAAICTAGAVFNSSVRRSRRRDEE